MMKNKIIIKQQHNFIKTLFTSVMEVMQVIGATTVILAVFSILVGDTAPFNLMIYVSLVHLFGLTPVYIFMDIRLNEKKEK